MAEKQGATNGPRPDGDKLAYGKAEGGNPPPTGLSFWLLIIAVFSVMFLVSLDKMIISTAIPQITDEFHSNKDIGWYGTAYLLTNCSYQLVFGKLYTFLPVKPTFLATLLLFEIGSAICGAAPNSVAFILGRVIAGFGAGGVLPGVIVILVYAVPLQSRAKYFGFFGAIFGLASVLGPTVGGAFTTHVTWRWCFYINLPIGGVVMLLVQFLLHAPEQPGTIKSFKEQLKQSNALGFICLVPGVVSLCLALQYGGTTYAWNNWRIILLFVISLLLLIGFVVVQFLLPEQAILPPRVLVQRSILAGFWTSICIGAHQTIFLYYMPLWFQAIKDKSAIQSGVDLLPMVLVTAGISILNGQLISFCGYYTPSLIFGACLTAVGAGLLTMLGVHSPNGMWIGFLIVYGLGQGFTSQAPNMAAQTVLPKKDISIGSSLMFFGQTLFGAIFVSVGQNVLDNQLAKRMADIPGASEALKNSTGATNVLDLIDSQYLGRALEGYNDALRAVFQVGLCIACLAVPGALAMEWRTVKKKFPPKDGSSAEKAKGQGNMPAEGKGEEKPAEKSHKAEEAPVNAAAEQK
ncbi:hypothetical protein NLG97_g4550 [Lecanicillium saksenae]|uniref:Uncharacterized protein n=1 Tax=Lecanicillium saksenae TaxID=468837 RepID=A0ACC1QXK2_9HYPO|nr:hypothetical protein NLG97_g4550 [Lecanicillium saksenae]